MAVWKKKEAGFMVIKPSEESAASIMEQFNNREEMEEKLEKFSIFNPYVEYFIGIFNSKSEIEEMMANQKFEVVEEPKEEEVVYRYCYIGLKDIEKKENWSAPITKEELENLSVEKGFILRSQVYLNGKWQGHENKYNFKDYIRIFCGNRKLTKEEKEIYGG